MLILNISSVYKPILSPPPLSLLNSRRLLVFTVALEGGDEPKKARPIPPSSSPPSSSRRIYAAQKDSQQFEVDPAKAREALKKLDQQLQSLSQKQVTPPKKKALDPNLPSTEMREDVPDISGSFLAYSAFALLIFTIFYNVLFYTVIQPSIDGPEPTPSRTMIEVPPKAPVSLQLTPIPPEAIMQP